MDDKTKQIYDAIRPKKTFLKRSIITISILAILALIYTTYYLYTKKEDISYEGASLQKGSIKQVVSTQGTLLPTDVVEVGSQISGIVKDVLVEQNDKVAKDQIIAIVDPEYIKQDIAKFNAQVNLAKANLEQAKNTLLQKEWIYQTNKKLYDTTKGQTPSLVQLRTYELEYLGARMDVNAKQASLKDILTTLNRSKLDLERSKIRSPIFGTILERSIEPGQTIAASFQTPTLFSIAKDLTKMDLVVYINEADISKISVGNKVSFSVDAYPNNIFEAKINKINFASKTSEDTTNNIISYETNIYVANDDLFLRPGMSANVDIVSKELKDVDMIPYMALFYTPSQSYRGEDYINSEEIFLKDQNASVYVINEDGRIQKRGILVGINDGKNVEVLEGLSKDDMVVLKKEDANKPTRRTRTPRIL